MLRIIPTAVIVLLNVIVIYYVLREHDRTRSGFFLIVNAFCLILWSGGTEFWHALDHEPWAVGLPILGTMLIPANMLYFAGTRPIPMRKWWGRPWVLAAVFLPAIVVTAITDFRVAGEMQQYYPFQTPTWEAIINSVGQWPLIYLVGYFSATILILATRYNQAPRGPERNLPKHLLTTILGPILFTAIFALTATNRSITPIPGPGLLMALIAQVGILVVIRQEEVERPLYLSRWIYYSIIILVGFLISHFIYTLYESVTAQVLLVPTIQRTVLATIILVVLMASLPRVQTYFDRLLFRRAWEYSRLVKEARAELRETRERLRRAERLSVVGEMAARIAHEIKNPLGPIKGYTQMMRERIEKMDEFPQRDSFLRHLGIISEEVDSLDKKVRHLLGLARKPDVRLEEEDLNPMVERAAILLRLESEVTRGEGDETAGMLDVIEDLESELPHVHCDRARIEEALSNLCRNAFEASGPTGRITLRTYSEVGSEGSPGVSIEVEDNGPGFSEAARAQLFEPFYTEKAGGTGLGLSIVKSHIDLHGGTVEFIDRRGGGTIARLWLPLEPPRARRGEQLTPMPEEDDL
ncbi:hypothetical protein KQI84_07055 [bacterium]|nr:hypothetical protein [bacterium]